MKTIKINSSSVFESKNKYQKLVKVCNLFSSKVELESDKKVFDIKSSIDAIERLKICSNAALNVSGEDENYAALLIKECINC